MLKSSRTLAALAAAALVAGACQEKLIGGKACPSLCPEQNLGFKDTVFLASEVIDTIVTVPGSPPLGNLQTVLVASYTQGGDSIVSGAVYRFDSLEHVELNPDTTKPPIPITAVDSATLQIYYNLPPTAQETLYVKDSTLTFHVWDVYVNAPDLDTGAVHARFYGTEVGTLTTTRDTINAANNQTINIPIDTAFLGNAIRTGAKVWLGVTVTSAHGSRVVLTAANASIVQTFQGEAPALNYFGVADTFHTASAVAVNARATQYGPAIPAMGNYQMIFKGSDPVPPGMIALGGLAQDRMLVVFKFPSWLVDSSTTVVKANLELAKMPDLQFLWDSASPDQDTIAAHPYALVAAPGVTDIQKLALLVGDVTLAAIPDDSALRAEGTGTDTLQFVYTAANLFNSYWKPQGTKVQRGLVWALTQEGIEPRRLLYYGTGAAPALQPRVHVSYVPHSIIGLP